MKAAAVHSKALLLVAIFWNEFLPWYILVHPLHIFKTYLSFARVSIEYFSFIFLLRTLFKPWKSIADPYPKSMLDIVGVVQAFTMNMTARAVGFVVRVLTILLGIFCQIALILFFTAYGAAWFLYPFYFVAACIILLQVFISSLL